MNDYEHNLGDEAAIKAYRKDQAERAKAERQQIKEVDAKEEAYRKSNNIGPEVRGYQHMIAEEKAQEKARSRAIENEEFKDKRTPKSDLIRQAELEKMKEILNKPKGGGGGSGGMGTGKMNRDISKNMKSGGKVSSASKRADGCAIRGKTKA
jgi:hypothetical protein